MRTFAFALVFSMVARGGSYTVAVIPPPAGSAIAYMFGINNSGQATGWVFGAHQQQAFIGSPSGSTVIPFPAGWSVSEGRAINNAGQVTGWGVTGSHGQAAFIGTTSGSTAVPIPSGWIIAEGLAINDSGQIAGDGSTTGAGTFVGNASGVSVLPAPPGWAQSNMYASAINASGQVAGSGFNGSIGEAFIGTLSGSSPIPPPTGWSNVYGYAINNLGQVAGNGYNGTTGQQAFIGTTSGSTPIPLPPGGGGATFGVGFGSLNDAGMVVGGSDSGGWIWDATNGTRLLSSMTPTGWVISTAISISQNGIILALGSLNGGASQYVELVPSVLVQPVIPATPAPGSGVLVGAGMLLVLAWRLIRHKLA